MRAGDIFPETGSRLPAVQRADLDAGGQALYDSVVSDPNSLAGLRGPAGIALHNPRAYGPHRVFNRFLRFETGLEVRLRELAILVSAREADSHFEWYQHEKNALAEGLDPKIVDIVRRRKPVRGIGAKEAAIIKLGREALGRHRVRRSTYAAALELFGGETLINIVMLMGEYTATAALLAVFAQQLPDGETSHLK